MNIVGVLKESPEPLPDWLRQERALSFDRAAFFGSRTVFYPGSGDDGHPVKICARSHVAHAFVYVDYSMARQAISDRLRNIEGHGVRGYSVEHEEDVEESALSLGGWHKHAGYPDKPRFPRVRPFVLFVVLVRDGKYDDSHGPERLSMLFVGGDGHAMYDVLYCQGDGTPPPYLMLIQDHEFGGNYDRFGRGGLLERIACCCGAHPKWLLVADNTNPWAGYRNIGAESEAGGMHGHPRRLFVRGHAL